LAAETCPHGLLTPHAEPATLERPAASKSGGMTMKLYMHPASTACRPVMLFAAESNIPLENEMVDILSGAHHQEPYKTINPNRLVPMLEDGDFRLTESSAILKYLADKIGSPAYPKDLKERARVNEVMDWLNVNFYRDFGYGLIYPQLFPHHRRRSDEAHAGAIDWGKENARNWLKILNDHWIGPDRSYLCGDKVTIADYFGAAIVSIGDFVGCDLAAYPNVKRWLDTMKKLPAWPKVNEVFDGLCQSLRDKEFVRI
jgi:glutathione S-transferase